MLKIKILIVDDEPDYCLIMKNYFQEKNYEVSLASTLKEGLEMIGKSSPDILILDNHLPDGQSWPHVKNITASSPSLKIYFISAYRQRSEFADFSSNVTVWEKPISLSSLENVFK
jgi:DNA-binding response OmpR family regulator